ncbi:hypothetical protein BC830DRAFT_1104791 [Chytriomyces sp. MP71]|nr:hypothetical protein BC830DRAFT_1104791 [Chytriomyces sp. MP71]
MPDLIAFQTKDLMNTIETDKTIDILMAENARLRKQNSDLESIMNAERSQLAEWRFTSQELESRLLNSIKTKTLQIKELKSLLSDVKFINNDVKVVTMESTRDNQDHQVVEELLLFENQKLVRHIVDISARIQERDLVIKTQGDEISELNRMVTSLMDDMEAQTTPLLLPGSMASRKSSIDSVNLKKSFTNLSDELGAPAPAPPASLDDDNGSSEDGQEGTLRARLAQFGLNTTGNRAVLKKRLQRYLARKKKNANLKEAAAASL